MRRLGLVLITVTVVCLVVAACGGQATPAPKTIPSTVTPVATRVALQAASVPFPAASATPVPPCSGETYTVQGGDMLSVLAVEFDVSEDEIAEASGVVSKNHLQIGQKLCIPAPTATPTCTDTRVDVSRGYKLYLAQDVVAQQIWLKFIEPPLGQSDYYGHYEATGSPELACAEWSLGWCVKWSGLRDLQVTITKNNNLETLGFLVTAPSVWEYQSEFVITEP